MSMEDSVQWIEQAQQQWNHMPLPALFEKAFQLHSRASDSQLSCDEAKKGCQLLRQCEAMIDKLGLFSVNEANEDISTGDLKYLLVPYFQAEFAERIASSDRLQCLKSTQSYLKAFISSCERLELLPDAELSAFSLEGPLSAEARRATKIARFRRLKAAESKLQDIRERQERRGRSMQASGKASTVEYGEEEVLDEFGDEEREAWLAQISLALCKALDLSGMLRMEEELLGANGRQDGEEVITHAMLDERVSKAEAWHKDAAMRAKVSKPSQPITCATFAQDVIEGRASLGQGHQHNHQPVFGPASLIGAPIATERQKIAAQVFQPSHRLPTMSIEDAGLKEMEIMTKWTERNAKLQEEVNSSWTNDEKKDNASDDEASEYKARAWDDWKDENPRGSGNKKLTPCG